jgi:dihydroorotase-like cyclic amidohydrolase
VPLRRADLAIQGAKVWHRGTFVDASISIAGEKINEISKTAHEGADEVIEARDRFVIPGLVDLWAHLWEGTNQGRVISSETKAAALGGVTTVIDASLTGSDVGDDTFKTNV